MAAIPTPVPDKVLNWLYSVLTSEYLDVNRTYSHAAEALAHYPSLSPRTEVYTYENGASALLLLLYGTLPVSFRGTMYRFPVSLWIPHAYPRESPIVFVTPSQDMLVRPGQYVAVDGRVYHPYLAQWKDYWDKSSIFDFLAVLRDIFAKEPPVRSKQPSRFPAGRGATPTPPPVPPTPEEWRKSQQPAPSTPPAPRPPELPPKPPKPQEAGQPEPRHELALRPPQLARPPIPPLPPGMRQSYQEPTTAYAAWQRADPYHQYGPQRVGGLNERPPQSVPRPVSQQPPPLQPQIATQRQWPRTEVELGSPVSPLTPEKPSPPAPSRYQQPLAPPLQKPQEAFRQPQQQHPQYTRPPHGQPHALPPAGPMHQPQQVQYIPTPSAQQPPKPSAPIPDLLSSPLEVTLPSQSSRPDIPVPPVPPNPEKDALLTAISNNIVSQITKTTSDNTAAIAPLQAQQAALRAAHTRLQSELEQLQQLDAAIASNEQILRDAMREADRVMEDAKRRKVPDVDEVLVAPTVVGGQLYSLCAEEAACADAMFVLSRALDRGRVGLDVFVKQTRSLAREQFLKKALIKKIAMDWGLD